MPPPTVDIIVPVWNYPNETRQCLAAVLSHSPGSRLIIVDNGNSRQIQLMLEEFFEVLGDNDALLLSSECNVGLVRAINMGLARSDSDYAVILCPHVVVTAGWLDGLIEAARTGIASPLFSTGKGDRSSRTDHSGDLLETRRISFSTLALKGEMRMLIGFFDEGMDGAEWCLKDFVSRAWSRGYRTCVTSASRVVCRSEPVLGSAARRRDMALSSRIRYQERWGIERHYLVYFGKSTEPCSLIDTMETVLNGCRQGHHFTLLLHRRQASEFRRRGWTGLHTSIELRILSRFMPERDCRRSIAALRMVIPDLVLVQGDEGDAFSGSDAAISLPDLAAALAAPAQEPPLSMSTISEVMP